MPELPEVETVRRELHPWLVGRTILRARRAEAPAGPKYQHLERADGQRIEAVQRRGKFLVWPLSGGDEVIVHLGMTGAISRDRPADHVRVVLSLAGAAPATLYFRDPRRFGRFLVAPGGDRAALPTLARMGPEPLDPAFTDAAFWERLDSAAAIKAHLLGQRPVAGLGNIYADEALWRARIHPETPARAVSRSKAKALRRSIITLLAAAVAHGGTTLRDYRNVAGDAGSYADALLVYGKAGRPCPRCGRSLVRTVVGQRATSHCPRCQRRWTRAVER